MNTEEVKSEELTAVIREIQQRVRSRHPAGVLGVGNIPIPDLMPLVHARDAAEAKVAAIGSVNPRAGGLVNAVIQGMKKLVARALDWHVREQVEFNRAAIACMQAALEALEEQNRAMSQLAGYFDGQLSQLDLLHQKVEQHAATVRQESQEFNDIRTHWAQWRAGQEEKMNRGEVYVLRTISELNAAFQHRTTLAEHEFRQLIREQHGNFNLALEKAGSEIQQRLWADLERIRSEYEQIIHAELRVVRQRGAAQSVNSPVAASTGDSVPAGSAPAIDTFRFADRFRGPEEHVRKGQEMYIARFQGAADVLDIGCGRGEFLQAAKAAGIGARGIDLNGEAVALCRSKGLQADQADAFQYLAAQPDQSLGGVYCSQVVEHLDPARTPELVRLIAAKLRRGAWVALETPNPECLAIFATHFYLDPTHTRPLPPMLLSFYFEEAGLGRIEIVRLAPAAESIPELNELPAGLRDRFFGGMDYAIFGVKL